MTHGDLKLQLKLTVIFYGPVQLSIKHWSIRSTLFYNVNPNLLVWPPPAVQLARRGLDVVLVSRSADKLQGVAKEIGESRTTDGFLCSSGAEMI